MKNDSIHINCPILLYSNFSDNIAIAKEETVHVDKFRRDIETLISEGYTIVSLLDILTAKKCESFLPERSVCIALFGGYEGQYRYAFPALAGLNVHANVFVATDLVGKSEYPGVSPFIPHFGWQEAAEMQKSGLVDIYAMWHPFDENKPVEPEVINKIELIKRHVPNSTPEAAFCMNMDNNTEEKQIALDKAGIELNISYYWSFRPENYNEGRLPYISVNQESNILDVIEHFNARINAQSNLNMELESIDSLVFDWKPKVGGVILPIDKTPRIKNLLRSAIPLSIIGATRRDREDLIVLNNYIEVVFRPWYHFFDYDNHMYLNWPELSCCRLTKDYIRTAKANVADIVLYGLEAGYYTDVWADQYYIPDKPGYKRQHLSHNILIYEYVAPN